MSDKPIETTQTIATENEIATTNGYSNGNGKSAADMEKESEFRWVNMTVDFLRGIVRPITTIAVTALVGYCVVKGENRNLDPDKMIPHSLAFLGYICYFFYYGETALTRFIDTYKNGRKSR